MSTRSRPARAGFRADIEGLRAVSVLAVLLWHAGLPWMPGGYAGVDVFFVISGFLMTTILLAEAQKRTPPKELLLGFYARRARRLLPAAVVALMGTAALTIIALPPTRWPGIGADIAASAGYVVNWRLAAGSVDYLGQQEPPSPVQHYWSLAVEEQFYLLWPVLIVGVLLLVRQRPARIRPAVGRLSLLVLVVSLGISVWLTRESAGQAYFVTHTRAWELALGSVVAVGASRWRGLSPGPARYVGWTGLGMVLLSLVVLDSGTPFPGTAALLPTVGAAMVLLAGPAAGAAGPVRPARCGCSACPRCSSSAGSPTAFTCGTGRWWWWRCSGGAPVTTCRCAGGWPPSPCRRCRLGCPTGMSSSRSGGEAAAARSRPDAPCTWACGPPWRGCSPGCSWSWPRPRSRRTPIRPGPCRWWCSSPATPTARCCWAPTRSGPMRAGSSTIPAPLTPIPASWPRTGRHTCRRAATGTPSRSMSAVARRVTRRATRWL